MLKLSEFKLLEISIGDAKRVTGGADTKITADCQCQYTSTTYDWDDGHTERCMDPWDCDEPIA